MLKVNYATLLIFCLALITTACIKQDVEPTNTTTNGGTNGGTNDNGGSDNGGSTDGSGSLNVNLDVNKILALVNAARTQGTTCGSTDKPPVGEIKWNDS